MYRQTRKSLAAKDNGFGLIELLVVIIILGILAAIAIPIFLHQRQRAVDASVKSDEHNMAVQLESFYSTTEAYPSSAEYSFTAPVVTIGAETVRLSPGNVPSVHLNGTGTAYCIAMSNPNKSAVPWVFQSDHGGLQIGAGDCTAYTTVLS
jgi:prepilin-type N-terminal cleavage/methylation domain-containing protein